MHCWSAAVNTSDMTRSMVCVSLEWYLCNPTGDMVTDPGQRCSFSCWDTIFSTTFDINNKVGHWLEIGHIVFFLMMFDDYWLWLCKFLLCWAWSLHGLSLHFVGLEKFWFQRKVCFKNINCFFLMFFKNHVKLPVVFDVCGHKYYCLAFTCVILTFVLICIFYLLTYFSDPADLYWHHCCHRHQAAILLLLTSCSQRIEGWVDLTELWLCCMFIYSLMT